MTECSKFQTIDASCVEYVHPWTDSCANASFSVFIDAVQHSGRIYFTVYMLSLLMHRKIPSVQKLKNAFLGILQSTAFLTANALGPVMCLCLLRAVLGNFNFLTGAFIPSFIASLVAILVERPSRRGLLTLYVTNIASETLFRMAVWRNLVRPIPYGDVLIFSTSMAVILYMYRSDFKKEDAIFSTLRVIIGPFEEGNSEAVCIPDDTSTSSQYHSKPKGALFESINAFCATYRRLLDWFRRLPRHSSCPHPSSCVCYVAKGGLRMFAVGYGFQFCMRVLLQAKRYIRNPSQIPRVLIDRKMLSLGMFLGGFPAIFRAMSCLLRWLRNQDSASHAIPAGLLAGLAFLRYRNNSAALYIMWKLVEILCKHAVSRGLLPHLPAAGILLYCTSTALLFHTGVWEPQNMRPSYWKFLLELTGGWILKINRDVLDVFGLETRKNLTALLIKNKTDISNYKF